MIPASIAQALPVGQNLNPFEIYFLLPEKEYKKHKGWINRFNKDTSITAGIFKIRIYPEELVKKAKDGEMILKLLKNSNVIARVLHPDESVVHVEHFDIFLDKNDPESFKEDLRLFILQLCRANLDEIRQELFLNHEYNAYGSEFYGNISSLERLEELFEGLSSFYTGKIEDTFLRRLRPLKNRKVRIKERPCQTAEPLFNTSFISFQVASAFSNYDVRKEKEQEVEKLNISRNEDGSFVIDFETLKKLLVEGNFIRPNSPALLETIPINITLKENRQKENKMERYPSLLIEIDHKKIETSLKGKEGAIIYIGTLLKRKFNKGLKRKEVTGIFKDLDKPGVTRSNFYDYIKPENKSAFEWIREIYSKIYGEKSFDEWFFNLINDWDGYTRRGVSQIRSLIGACLKDENVKDIEEYVTIRKNKESKWVEYYIDRNPESIHIPDSLKALLTATKTYIDTLSTMAE